MTWELGSVHDPFGIPTQGALSRLLPPSAGQGPEERRLGDAQGLSLLFQAGGKGTFAVKFLRILGGSCLAQHRIKSRAEFEAVS